jgi:hypothetical protein
MIAHTQECLGLLCHQKVWEETTALTGSVTSEFGSRQEHCSSPDHSIRSIIGRSKIGLIVLAAITELVTGHVSKT